MQLIMIDEIVYVHMSIMSRMSTICDSSILSFKYRPSNLPQRTHNLFFSCWNYYIGTTNKFEITHFEMILSKMISIHIGQNNLLHEYQLDLKVRDD